MRRRAGQASQTAPAPSSRPEPQPHRWVLPVTVAALTFFVFLPALGNGFVNWDDDKNFLNNPHYRGLSGQNLRWILTNFHLGHYHPLTWLSLSLDYEVWGVDARGYHLTNVLLHAANAALFSLLARRLLGGGAWVAALAGLLFAVHPLRVESVAWASERRDVLSGFFYLAAVLAYLKAQREGPRGRWLGVSLAAFAGGLLSKVIVVSLPVVLLVLDAYPLRRWKEWRTALVEKIPYLGLAGLAAAAALGLQPAGVSGFAEHVAVLPALRLGLSLYGLAFYLWKTLLPFGLYPQYVMAADLTPFDWRILLSAAVVAVLTMTVVALRRSFPAGLAVWACYVAGLLPVLSIVRVDPQQYVADHHTYLATLGLALLAAAGLARLGGSQGRATGAAVVLLLAALSWRQTGVWRDSVTLWTHTLSGSPQSVVAHNNLGEALAAANRFQEAIPHFEQAIVLRPDHAQAWYNLGRALQRLGKPEEAMFRLERAIAIEPGFAVAHNDLANGYAERGRLEEARRHYEMALHYQPDSGDTHYNLGRLLHTQGKLEPAIVHYRQALALRPSLADAHNNWGMALEALGRPAEALAQYRRALAVDPRNADAHNNLGVGLAAAGRRAEALEHFREALRWNPSHRDAAANLVRAQAQ
jgi:Tfp pilus assembly protein PilF